jgi:hypothetical protein
VFLAQPLRFSALNLSISNWCEIADCGEKAVRRGGAFALSIRADGC